MSSIVKKIVRITAGCVIAGAPMFALSASTYDEAEVVAVEPIYETVSREIPVQACREEQVTYQTGRNRSATGPILGAIIGGALGNAVGHEKRNKQVGTVVGAVLGGSIGADISRRQRGGPVRTRTEEVCDTRYEVRSEEQLAGYDVRYVYGGTTYQTRMPRDPGPTLRVRVRPAE
ncbi:MAG: glycine zipper 2TM domain-containing protein [Pseudomonadales bacterium]|nr:glycine zipper 2TM domain-containing protein [Pseudomonadales bacterium]